MTCFTSRYAKCTVSNFWISTFVFAVPSYMLGGDIRPREFMAPAKVEENGPVSSYTYPDDQLNQVPETEEILEDNFAMQPNGALQVTMNSVPERLASPIEEPVVEPQKHTYASIVCDYI